MPTLIDDEAEIRQARLQVGHQCHCTTDVRKLDVRYGKDPNVIAGLSQVTEWRIARVPLQGLAG
jgi:hypothetical protein